MSSKSFTTLFIVTMVVTFAGYTNPANAQYVKDGLLGYWPFDADTIEGQTVKDVFGNNDGTIQGNLKIVKGKIGEALEFPDVAFVKTELRVSPAEYKELTMEAWAKPQIHPDYWKFVMDGDDGAWDRGIGLIADHWDIQAGPNDKMWTPGAKADLDKWQHLVAVYTPNEISFYKNGVRSDYGSGGSLGPSTQPLLIGGNIACGPRCYFIGAIDEVRVYGRALREAEVQQNFTKAAAVEYSTKKLALTWGEIKVSK